MVAKYKKLWPPSCDPSMGPIDSTICRFWWAPQKVIFFTGQLCIYCPIFKRVSRLVCSLCDKISAKYPPFSSQNYNVSRLVLNIQLLGLYVVVKKSYLPVVLGTNSSWRVPRDSSGRLMGSILLLMGNLKIQLMKWLLKGGMLQPVFFLGIFSAIPATDSPKFWVRQRFWLS